MKNAVDVFQTDMQLSAAKHLRWMPAHIRANDHELYMDGWALALWDAPENLRILVNGCDFAKIEWMPSPDIEQHFDALPHTKAARFRCWHPIDAGKNIYQDDGFVRLNVTGPFGEHRHSYRTAWFKNTPALEVAMPSPAQIERVIGSDHMEAFKLGGATILKRIAYLLQERFDRPLNTFESVLDWGCGAGRLTRYLPLLAPSVTGIDIDPDNIRGCAETIKNAHFHVVGLHPPTPFSDSSFDLIIGISVLTHLDEQNQDAWLGELQRIVKPGGLVLLSIQGMAQSALYRTPSDWRLAVQREGIVNFGKNSQLDEVLDYAEYYVDVIQSHEYVMTHWSKYFDVIEIIEAIAGNQDLVILRRR